MKTSNRILILLGLVLIILGAFEFCIPVGNERIIAVFKNYTNDTLYIGASHYDNIDSLEEQVNPCYNIVANRGIDTTGISLWKGSFFRSDSFIYPDSACSIDAQFLFHDTDTCYFFLIKWRDAKNFSLSEIYSKQLYRKWIVAKDNYGRFNRNIR